MDQDEIQQIIAYNDSEADRLMKMREWTRSGLSADDVQRAANHAVLSQYYRTRL